MFEVTKDDKTLWVNADKCLGRICHFGFEVMSPTRMNETLYHYPKGGTKQADWILFKEKMKEIHNIEFDETPPKNLFG